jgi:hypothetical protein
MEVHLRTALGQLDPSGQESMVMLYQYWQGMRDTLAEAFEASSERRAASGERREALVAALALALDFQTWRTLVRGQGLDEEKNRGDDGGDGAVPDAHLVTAF